MTMNAMWMLAAAAPTGTGEGPIAEVANQFGVTWPLLFSQIVLFVMVGYALKKWAYGPLQVMLEQRRERIAESLKQAQQIKEELAHTEAARQEILNQTNAHATKLIEEARAAAARVQEQETQKAIAEAEQIIARAREATLQDHARMLAELRREVGRLVVATTTKVSGKVLTPEDQQRLIQETSRELAA